MCVCCLSIVFCYISVLSSSVFFPWYARLRTSISEAIRVLAILPQDCLFMVFNCQCSILSLQFRRDPPAFWYVLELFRSFLWVLFDFLNSIENFFFDHISAPVCSSSPQWHIIFYNQYCRLKIHIKKTGMSSDFFSFFYLITQTSHTNKVCWTLKIQYFSQ